MRWSSRVLGVCSVSYGPGQRPSLRPRRSARSRRSQPVPRCPVSSAVSICLPARGGPNQTRCDRHHALDHGDHQAHDPRDQGDDDTHSTPPSSRIPTLLRFARVGASRIRIDLSDRSAYPAWGGPVPGCVQLGSLANVSTLDLPIIGDAVADGRMRGRLVEGSRGPARPPWLLYFAADIHTAVARSTPLIMASALATLGAVRGDAR